MAGKEDWAEFVRALQLSARTPKELAERLRERAQEFRGLDPEAATEFDDPVLISTWRQGRKRPRFDQLPLISRVLSPDDDPTYLARLMGIIPDDSALRQQMMLLQKRVDDLAAVERKLDLRTADERNAAVSRIVQVATQTDRWAVAVWPAMEGPTNYRFHVADRLDFTLIDGTRCSDAEEVCELLAHEEEVHKMLTAAHAVPSPRARPRWADFLCPDDPSVPKVGSYSVQLLSASFPPGTTLLKHHRSIAIVAVSVAAWAGDTAGFLARILTYGLQSSRSMLTETFGYRGHQHVTLDERNRRAELHTDWLRVPPPRYVWTHFGRPERPSALFPDPDHWHRDLTCVWLRESDNLLDKTSPSPEHAEDYKRARDRIDDYVTELDDERLICIEVDHPECAPEEVRNQRMEQALIRAADAIDAMLARGQLDREAVADAMNNLQNAGRSSIAKTTYRWLRDKDRLILTR